MAKLMYTVALLFLTGLTVLAGDPSKIVVTVNLDVADRLQVECTLDEKFMQKLNLNASAIRFYLAKGEKFIQVKEENVTIVGREKARVSLAVSNVGKYVRCSAGNSSSGHRLKYAELTPVDPIGVLGRPLEMNCTLSEYFIQSRNVTASDIYFSNINSTGDDLFLARDVTVIDRRTARYSFRKASNGSINICCNLRNYKEEDKACQHAFFGELPATPKIEEYYIQNWEQLYFRWSTNGSNPIFETKYTAWWMAESDSNLTFQMCPRQTNTTCIVPIPQPSPHGGTYIVKVIGSNIGGKSTDTVYIRDLKPSRVGNLKTKATATSVRLSWETPKPDHTFIYEITYQCRWDSKKGNSVEIEGSTDGMNLTLQGLYPYTIYNISVRSQVSHGSLYSDYAFVSVKTLQAVPSAPAGVSRGGFLSKKGSKDGMRNVTIYWQHIPRMYRNGIITKYRVQAVYSKAGLKTFLVSRTNLSHEFRDVPVDEEIKFYVDGATQKGFNEQLKSKPFVLVPPQNQVLSTVNDFTAIAVNRNHVKLTWEALDGKYAFNYTIYWCKFKSTDYSCKSKVKWKPIAGPATRTQINLKAAYTQFLVGIATDSGLATSGIYWNPCIYYIAAVADPPDIDVRETTYSSVTLTLKGPLCKTGKGFPQAYNIYYCVTKEPGCPEKQVKVEKKQAERVILTGLQSRARYYLKVTSMSMAGESFLKKTKFVDTIDPDGAALATGTLVAIIATTCVMLILFVVGIIYCLRWQKKLLDKCLGPEPIHMPTSDAQPNESDSILEGAATVIMRDSENLHVDVMNAIGDAELKQSLLAKNQARNSQFKSTLQNKQPGRNAGRVLPSPTVRFIRGHDESGQLLYDQDSVESGYDLSSELKAPQASEDDGYKHGEVRYEGSFEPFVRREMLTVDEPNPKDEKGLDSGASGYIRAYELEPDTPCNERPALNNDGYATGQVRYDPVGTDFAFVSAPSQKELEMKGQGNIHDCSSVLPKPQDRVAIKKYVPSFPEKKRLQNGKRPNSSQPVPLQDKLYETIAEDLEAKSIRQEEVGRAVSTAGESATGRGSSRYNNQQNINTGKTANAEKRINVDTSRVMDLSCRQGRTLSHVLPSVNAGSSTERVRPCPDNSQATDLHSVASRTISPSLADKSDSSHSLDNPVPSSPVNGSDGDIQSATQRFVNHNVDSEHNSSYEDSLGAVDARDRRERHVLPPPTSAPGEIGFSRAISGDSGVGNDNDLDYLGSSDDSMELNTALNLRMRPETDHYSRVGLQDNLHLTSSTESGDTESITEYTKAALT